MHLAHGLYTQRMDLRHLRCLVAIVDVGGFTGAAAELGTTQPSVSRTLAALEDELAVRLLRRTSREIMLTAAGERVLARARRVLADVDDLVRDATAGGGRLRLGHAWAALGEHTVDLQRRWAAEHPGTELSMVRTNSPTGGLAEGNCDIAIIRTAAERRAPDQRFDEAVVGVEARVCALAADHPLARRRLLRLADLADQVVAIDPRTGTTTAALWPPERQPAVEEVGDVDDWLDVIAAGRCVGVTAESTLAQYRRSGIVFRRLRDAPPVPVRVLWWRADPHPAVPAVVGLLAQLYRR